MRVSAAFAHDGPAAVGFDVVDLPPTAALTTVHHGAMDTVGDTWQELVRQAEAQGHRLTGPGREVYLEVPEDPSAWVTELQQPVEG
jgi:effector-binding domain-containing protein